jgi:hypothetical protein
MDERESRIDTTRSESRTGRGMKGRKGMREEQKKQSI